MCIDSSSLPLSWDCGFRRNLNDAEVEEFARLSAELEEVLLIQGRGDSRVWRLDSSGLFSVKSFSAHLIANPSSLIFLPSRVIWKAKVPSKVKLLVWLIAHGKVNTCEVIQRKNPYLCFCPNWCILCKCANESLDHLFLSCPIVSSLWSRLCQATGMTGGNFSSCYDLLSSGMNFFGGERKGAVLGTCAVMALFWVVWGERNRRIFENVGGDEVDEIWERVRFWTSLWASISSEFKDMSLGSILLDWKAAVL